MVVQGAYMVVQGDRARSTRRVNGSRGVIAEVRNCSHGFTKFKQTTTMMVVPAEGIRFNPDLHWRSVPSIANVHIAGSRRGELRASDPKRVGFARCDSNPLDPLRGAHRRRTLDWSYVPATEAADEQCRRSSRLAVYPLRPNTRRAWLDRLRGVRCL